jgi:hypothetical protein
MAASIPKAASGEQVSPELLEGIFRPVFRVAACRLPQALVSLIEFHFCDYIPSDIPGVEVSSWSIFVGFSNPFVKVTDYIRLPVLSVLQETVSVIAD